MSQSLLKLQIGPVQDFIAQARSTRDLWSGSYLLSWLMAAGLAKLVREIEASQNVSPGEARRSIIYPNSENQPLVALHLAGGAAREPAGSRTNQDRLTPNLPNVLVGQVPADAAKQIAERVAKAIRDEWVKIAAACWNFCARESLAGDASNFTRQADRFLSIAWQVTPPAANHEEAGKIVAVLSLGAGSRDRLMAALRADSNGYAALYLLCSWQLDSLNLAIPWKIAAEPAALSRDEFWARYDHLNLPEKFEATGGKLFWNDEQRLHVLAMLLEAVGLRRALALCPPEAVRAALADERALNGLAPKKRSQHKEPIRNLKSKIEKIRHARPLRNT